MLENNDDTTTSEEQPQTKPAPRRRRAASRPAGPPAETPAIDTAPDEIPEQPAKPEEPASGAPAENTDTAPEQAEESAAPAPTRRRRAATKPAGEPTTTRRRRVKEVEPAAEQPEAEPTSEAPAEQPAADAGTPEQPEAAPAAEAGEAAPAERPARRRATRKTSPPKESVEAEQPAPAPVSEPETEQAPEAAPEQQADDAAAEQSAPQPKQQRAPQRRRRASRPAADPEAPKETESTKSEANDEDDPIGAALRAAEEVAEARKAVLSDPFLTDPAREKQLAALAGAIAGEATAATDEDEDEDQPSDGETAEAPASESDDAELSDDSAGQDENDDESSDDGDSGDEGGEPRRRRRRRGGRRRRRSGPRDDSDQSDGDDSGDSDSSEEPGDKDASAEKSDQQDSGSSDSDGEGDDSGTTRRRRRRRRGGSGGDGGSSSDDEVTGIEGSTRMAAKRQRRKESRAAGRRRAPILSEAEFLTRRESVDRRMVIRQADDYTQLAVVEDNILVEHYVDKASATSLIGNIYLGKVQNVLPSMEAAFIDIGRGRNAVLYAGEVDWSLFGVTGENRKVENVLKSGQSVLVQVTKDPVGAKGARLTGHISLPGRYIVYSPGGHLSGISRKLPDTERNRLRTVLGSLISDEESVIVRTAAEGASEDELVRDVNRLKAQWEVIEKKSKQGGSPQALYAEPDLTLRIVRDLFTEDFAQLVVQGNGGPEDAYEAISAYVGHVAPHLADRLVRFEGTEDGPDAFAEFKIDDQIAKALDRKVYLPSGGSLVIDRTEAMTVIDVNTGRFTGSGGNLEATVTSNNLEAAEEIVRQLRLRDLGGIIVIDFIDMVLPSNRDLLLRRLVECLGRDRTRHQVAEVTSLGLVQLTRKRIGTGLQEAFTEPCEHCNGAGYLRFDEPVESQAPSDGGERKGRRRGKK